MANEQQNMLKAKKTVTISIEEYETFKAENARLNQQIQWLLEAYVFLRGSASVTSVDTCYRRSARKFAEHCRSSLRRFVFATKIPPEIPVLC